MQLSLQSCYELDSRGRNEMTCNLCNDYQDGKRESGDGGGGVSYYRINRANVMVVGCNEHLRIMFKMLNKYYEEHGELKDDGTIR